MSNTSNEFTSFSDFYPFYLEEHRNKTCRRLHFIGSAKVLLILAYVLITSHWLMLIAIPIIGYGYAWIGHFFYEHNKPATFRYPIWSLMGDWVMFKDILIGRIKW